MIFKQIHPEDNSVIGAGRLTSDFLCVFYIPDSRIMRQVLWKGEVGKNEDN